MTADVNVTEKVARALADNGSWPGVVTSTDLDGAFAALRVLRDPEVLAGIAEALVQGGVLGCCVDCPTPHARSYREEQAREVAAAVVDWLAGGAR